MKAAEDIVLFLPTLKREVEAFANTRTNHDFMRVMNAANYLSSLVAKLGKEVKPSEEIEL